ncbi:hypothetical protein KSP39_PZI007976 [Platanthera zijinensis]|uniref:Secreted protein n=1 Tax=Platanthera zijinensis TaxID=2320716 RepID=A0AAP0G8Z8_9ASPA
MVVSIPLFFIACSLCMHLPVARQYPMEVPATQLHGSSAANPPSAAGATMKLDLKAATPLHSTLPKNHPYNKSKTGGEVKLCWI